MKLLTLVNSEATLERFACRAVGLPCRSSPGLARDMVAWIGPMKRFTLSIDRGSASVLV
jgi:hypothetical protein